MSGVKGLAVLNAPPTLEDVSSLQAGLGRPCPDSRTKTSNLFVFPRNAIPVGKFKPEANTDAVKPAGSMILGGNSGLKNAVLSGQSGFDTT